MLLKMSDADSTARYKCLFEAAETGFLIMARNQNGRLSTKLGIIVSKDTERRTLSCYELNPRTIESIAIGTQPASFEVSESEVLNMFMTEITDRMCHKDHAMRPRCRACGVTVIDWDSFQLNNDDPRRGKKNYRTDLNGLCYHIDCTDEQSSV